MSATRVELVHNTPEQVREYLAAALELVEELEPPEDLRVALFTKAVELTASKNITAAMQAPTLLGGGGMSLPH